MTMKVLLHYEDHENEELHKSLKITLPKSWKSGPTSKLLEQFVESYNATEGLGSRNPLDPTLLHLALRQADEGSEKSQLVPLASDAVVLDRIPDRGDVYVMHGPSLTQQDLEKDRRERSERRDDELKNTVPCTHFGCHNRFPRGGPYPECRYHKSPPVFHETAKFWSCCPQKKAYDWEDFQNIPGCQTGTCTETKENEGQKMFLGGTDLRAQAGDTVKLKSIDDFNKSQAAGGAEAAPVLDRLQRVFQELGIEAELFNQVVEGIKKELQGQTAVTDADLLNAVKEELGKKLKSALKSIAAEQLRIK